MIRTLLRNLLLMLALLFFLAAALALGLDSLRLSSLAASGLITLGEFWSQLDPASLAFVRGLIGPQTWDQVGVWLMLQPAWAVLGFIGFFLLALRPMRERKRGKFG